MAKDAVLTVKVNAEQFTAFQANIANLSSTMTQLMTQFTAVQTTVNQTAQSIQTLQSSLAGLGAQSRTTLQTVGKITDHFGKWFTLIYGTVAMLGTGSGGLNKLQQLGGSVVQQQRRQAQLGGEGTGEISSTIRSGSILDPNASGSLKAIREGQMGFGPERTALMSLLGRMPKADEKPTDLYRELINKIVDIAKQDPQHAYMRLKALHADKLINTDTLQALSGPGGERLRGEFNKDEKRRVPDLPQNVQTAWTDLIKEWETTGAVFVNKIAIGLKPLAEALSSVAIFLRKWMESIGPGLRKSENGLIKFPGKLKSWIRHF